jgi:hypothetical protein
MRNTTIEISSFVYGLSNKERLKLTEQIINESSADILLFSGHTIGFVNDIEILKNSITNKSTEVILELEDINSSKINNCLYRIEKGILTSLFTNQQFINSREIENNYQLAERFLHELETKRVLLINDLKVLIIQCGELNILRNFQTENNRVEFRLFDDKILKTRFRKIIKESNIILNPIHTPMGNQGKMNMRRIFLSKNKRYYFSASNTKENSDNLDLKSMQYAFYNGKPLTIKDVNYNKNSITRSFEIKNIC